MYRRREALLLGAALPLSSFAQTKQKRKAPAQSPRTDAVAWLSIPADEADLATPQAWPGHDLKRIATAAMELVKDDAFESPEARARRIESQLQAPVYGRVALASTLAFRVPVKFAGQAPRAREFSAQYDPSSEKLKFVHPGDTLWLGPKSTTPMSQLTSVVEISDLGSYAGQNAYGARAQVRKMLSRHYVLLGSMSGYSSSFESPEVSISPAEARKSTENLHLFVVGKLLPPYYYEQAHHHKPTISDPNEHTMLIHNLFLDVNRVVGFLGSQQPLFDSAVQDKKS